MARNTDRGPQRVAVVTGGGAGTDRFGEECARAIRKQRHGTTGGIAAAIQP